MLDQKMQWKKLVIRKLLLNLALLQSLAILMLVRTSSYFAIGNIDIIHKNSIMII